MAYIYNNARNLLVAVLAVCIHANIVYATGPTATNSESQTQLSGNASTQIAIPSNSLIQDWDQDGNINIAGFGDSITRGTGDNQMPGSYITSLTQPSKQAGYPLRVSNTLNIPVLNVGLPGENLADDGILRFIKFVKSTNTDLVILSEGANDAMGRLNPSELEKRFQIMVNVAGMYSTRVAFATIPPSCCQHDGREPITNAYNQSMYSLVSSNELALIDIHRAFLSTCRGSAKCYLLNLPEGLHPNKAGYDVMGEMVSSVLLGFDILTTEGSVAYEQALKIPHGMIITVPIT